MAMFAAVSVPAPTATVELPAPDEPTSVRAPERVREFYPLNVRPFEAATGSLIETDVAAAAVSTVTVIAVGIVTVSPATGTMPPVHVPVALQLPVAAAVIAAASALLAEKPTTSARVKKTETNLNILRNIFLFNI